MQLSMFDTDDRLKVKKNTTNNNYRAVAQTPLLFIMSRGIAYSRYMDDPCASRLSDESLFIISYSIYAVKHFLPFFQKIFYFYFPPKKISFVVITESNCF